MRKIIKLVQLLLIALTLLVGLFCVAIAWMAFNNGDPKGDVHRSDLCVNLLCRLYCLFEDGIKSS